MVRVMLVVRVTQLVCRRLMVYRRQRGSGSPLSVSVLVLLISGYSHLASGEESLQRLLAGKDFGRMTAAGINFQHGRGVQRNLDHAIKLLCTAARGGYASAQYELGWLYLNGRHGRRDEQQAGVWLRKAAEQGDDHARRLLRFVADGADQTAARCPLASGINYPEPLKSKPNPSVKEIRHWVKRLAPDYQLPPRLVVEVIRAESNFDVRALSPKNAQGLMQLMPKTARRFGVVDTWDPLQNIRGGMAYLRWLLDYFEGDVVLALAGYNAGERAVETYRGVPPYQETQRYVALITSRLGKDHGT